MFSFEEAWPFGVYCILWAFDSQYIVLGKCWGTTAASSTICNVVGQASQSSHDSTWHHLWRTTCPIPSNATWNTIPFYGSSWLLLVVLTLLKAAFSSSSVLQHISSLMYIFFNFALAACELPSPVHKALNNLQARYLKEGTGQKFAVWGRSPTHVLLNSCRMKNGDLRWDVLSGGMELSLRGYGTLSQGKSGCSPLYLHSGNL